MPKAILAKKGNKDDTFSNVTNCLNFPQIRNNKRGKSAGYAPLSTGKVEVLPPAPAGAKAGNVSTTNFKDETDRILSDVLNGKKSKDAFSTHL